MTHVPSYSDSAVLQTEHLRREFGRTCAIDDVTLSVAPGSVLALLGPNGAGKTTLMRLLRGLIRPTSGQSGLFGVTSVGLPDSITRRIGFLGGGRPPRWTRLRDLAALQASVSPDFDRVLAHRLLREHDLSWDQRWAVLSRGQQRWSLFAIGLAARPELWLLDEPCDGLDTASRRELYDLLRVQCNEHGTTVVVSTHLIGDIERVADDVALLHRGRLLLHAPLEALREEVCELEVPDGVELDLPEETTVLATQSVDEMRLIYLRETGSAAEIEDRWRERMDRRMMVRPVGLETLYLAMTES